jgi:uncharacterized protein (DUF1778 family)
MLDPEIENQKMQRRSIQLLLNPQQCDLLQRAAIAEGKTSIEALVRHAILQTDQAAAQEKSVV